MTSARGGGRNGVDDRAKRARHRAFNGRNASAIAAAVSLSVSSPAAGQTVVQCSPIAGPQSVSPPTTVVVDVAIATNVGRIPFVMSSDGPCAVRVQPPAAVRCIDGHAEVSLASGQNEVVVWVDVAGAAPITHRVSVADRGRCRASLQTEAVVDSWLFAPSGARAGGLRAPSDVRQASSMFGYVRGLLARRDAASREHAERVLAQLEQSAQYSASYFVWQLVRDVERLEVNWAGVLVCANHPSCRPLLLPTPMGTRLASGRERRRLLLSRGAATFDLSYVHWIF